MPSAIGYFDTSNPSLSISALNRMVRACNKIDNLEIGPKLTGENTDRIWIDGGWNPAIVQLINRSSITIPMGSVCCVKQDNAVVTPDPKNPVMQQVSVGGTGGQTTFQSTASGMYWNWRPIIAIPGQDILPQATGLAAIAGTAFALVDYSVNSGNIASTYNTNGCLPLYLDVANWDSTGHFFTQLTPINSPNEVPVALLTYEVAAAGKPKTGVWVQLAPTVQPAGRMFSVDLANQVGSAGSGAARSTYTYDVYPRGHLVSTPVISPFKLAPEVQRPKLAVVTPATAGEAYYDTNAVLHLWTTNEQYT